MTERKPRGICPKCGKYNWEVPTYYVQGYINQHGTKCLKRISETKYKCRKCKHIWSETWDEGEILNESDG